MLRREDGMWSGTAIEAPDPAGLAAFYAELLGWSVVHEEPGTTVLAPPQGAVDVVFQQADGYQRPTMHVDPVFVLCHRTSPAGPVR